jgi:hypothetical protein
MNFKLLCVYHPDSVLFLSARDDLVLAVWWQARVIDLREPALIASYLEVVAQ